MGYGHVLDRQPRLRSETPGLRSAPRFAGLPTYTLSASEVVFHEEALYQVHLPLPLPFTPTYSYGHRTAKFGIIMRLRGMFL